MSLIEHAKQEFLAVGYKPIEKEKDDPNRWIQENVLELIEVFSKQGHSGSSAPFCVNYFNKLARYEPLSPIKCTDDEWTEVSNNIFQNKRLSSVFKDGKNGDPYFLDAIVWNGENDVGFTGSVQGISSRQYINLPFSPKTFYIDVIEVGDDYEIKDRTQLREVWEYYKRDIEKDK